MTNLAESVPLLKTTGLERSFRLDDREVPVLQDINLTLEHGSSLALVGPSGSGKSTLLGILGGLDRPSAGRVELMGQEISSLGEDRLADLRNRYIGFVFQFFYLMPMLNALENVVLPARLGVANGKNSFEQGRELLTRLGLADKMHHKPRQLSGGEQQRVAIARALINRPALILADEPTGNLDAKTSERIMDLLWEMHKDTGASLVYVTHDMNLTKKADRVVEIRNGTLLSVSAEQSSFPVKE